MRPIKVVGLGVINRLGTSPEKVWATLDTAKPQISAEAQTPYESFLTGSKRRRVDRYSDMAVYVAWSARNECETINEADKTRIGTIFSTGYGPMTSSLAFAKSVREGDPDLCSPTVFAATVPNACVGHVCMNLGYKGASTAVMGSNSLGYAQSLLSKGAADYIFAGAVEEYNESLFSAYRQKGTEVGEGAVAFLLTREECPHTKKYATLVDFYECNIGGNPLTVPLNKDMVSRNLGQVFECFSREKPDLIISSCDGFLARAEKDALIKNGIVASVICPKKYFSETLGTLFSMNALFACLILEKGRAPVCFKKKTEAIQSVLVTGYDVSGNYIAYLLKK